jgi:hypothetical protein
LLRFDYVVRFGEYSSDWLCGDAVQEYISIFIKLIGICVTSAYRIGDGFKKRIIPNIFEA